MRHSYPFIAAVTLAASLLWASPVRAQVECVDFPTGTATINGSVTAQEAPGTPVFANVTATADIGGHPLSYSGIALLGGTFSIPVGAPATYVITAAPLDFVHAPELYDGVLTNAQATTVSVTQGQVVNNIDFTVVIGETISGTVSEQGSGDPIENVSILAARSGDLAAAGFGQTDANGEYTIAGIPQGDYQLSFFPDQTSDYLFELYDDNPAAPGDLLNVPGGGVTDVDAALAIGGRIEGTVSDSGGPVQNAAVAAVPANGYSFAGDTTDASGNYSLLVPAGASKVFFGGAAAGLVNEFYDDKPDQASADDVNATSGATTSNIDATLAASGQITGNVTDATSGDPIEGVLVTAYNASTDAVASSATTNALGSYAIIGNLPSSSYKVGFVGPTPEVGSPGYVSRFYSSKPNLAAATSVAVTAPNATANIDQELVPCGGATTTTTTGGGTTTTTSGGGTTTTTVGGEGECGDPLAPFVIGTGNAVSASDALFILRVSVSLDSCLPCVCDVNDSGGVTATDALTVLQAAVSLPVTLNCPACS